MDLYKELDKSEKEIFRYEALQEYFSDGSDEIENKISQQWKEKGEVDMDLMKEWHDFISKKISGGVKMVWVRLVEFPLNEYTKSGLYIYKKRIKYGIDIRVITKEKFNKLNIEIKDFYIIDKTKILLMNFGNNNEYLGCELDSKNLQKYKESKDLLIKNSIPVSDFRY
ncbi:MAG: hypothetical protein KJ600_05945 [Nanoarchaeota archaeon]|nr:hypothetical protein [Nanoarchaeota archaeon]MBU1104069.1 hypothetical protein [Nanoarchaeota archaeon]